MIKKFFNNNYLLSIITKILIIFFSLVTSSLISRSLGVSGKGDYSYVVNISSILIVIFSLGIGQTYSFFKKNYSQDFLLSFVILTLIQGVTCLAISIIFYFIDNNIYIFYALLIAAFGIIRNNLSVICTIEDINKKNTSQLISQFIYVLLVIFVVVIGFNNVKNSVIMLILSEIFFSSFLLIVFAKKNIFNSGFMLKKDKISKIYKFGFLSMIMTLLTTLNYNIDTIFLKNLSSSYYVGLYSISVSLANMLWIIPDAFKDVMVYKSSSKDNILEIVNSMKFNIYLSLFIIILFIFFGKYVIIILYGDDFINSYYTAIILLIGSLSMIIHKIISPLYISNGKQKLLVVIFSFAVVFNVVLNYILIPQYNIIGASFSSVVSYTIVGLTILIIFIKDYKVPVKSIFLLSKDDINFIKSKITSLMKKKERN